MFGRESKDGAVKGVQDIQAEELEKIVDTGGKAVRFRVRAMTGVVNGRREVLDEALLDAMTAQIAGVLKANSSRYNPVPDEVTIGVSIGGKRETEARQDALKSREPRYALEQVVLNEDAQRQIKTALAAVRYQAKLTGEWGLSSCFSGERAIILNFYGKPGTGKSMAAEAVAQALGKRVLQVNYAELESKYVGETPKNIRGAFALAAQEDAVLVFDEADSFLGKRLTAVTQSADYGVNITRSVLLMELERFRGVVIFTTNLIRNYDEAFKRRILLSVHFDLPDRRARETIWRLHLGKKLPLTGDVTAERLAGRYEGVSGADIKDMVFYAALHTLEQGLEALDDSAFDEARRVIAERYADRDGVSVSREIITEEQYLRETGGDGHA